MPQIEKLIHKLPRQDQPIYGYQQYDQHVTTDFIDRMVTIEQITNQLASTLNRPLSILNLNCCQGFFALHLANQGHKVLGVDENKPNIELCNALAQRTPQFDVQFIQIKTDDIFKKLAAEQFDLIIIMKEFKASTLNSDFIEQLKTISGITLLEVSNSPKNTKQKTKSILKHKEVTLFPFYCEIETPNISASTLFFLSTRVLLINNQFWKFDTWKEESHALAGNTHQNSRRYYFSKDRMIKFFRFDGTRVTINKTELSRELNFLSNNRGFPKIFNYKFSINYGWIERELIIGENLLDVILNKIDFNPHFVIESLLKQLVALEKNGLYHRDLRVWNMIISPKNKIHLIDYGDISEIPTDVVYPDNIFFSFFITINNLITKEIHPILPIRSAKMSPNHLPNPYCSWLNEIWSIPTNEWTFKLIYKKWKHTHKNQTPQQLFAQQLWNAKTEQYVNTLRHYHDHQLSELTKQINQLKNNYEKLIKRVAALEKNT
jgi:O-antigen chain-terminating bifunctional methyltransferase/kinase